VFSLLEMALVAIRVERGRVTRGPKDLVAELRARGKTRRRRSRVERQRLRRAIRLVDRCFPSGGNCYRRTLIEIAMDAGAASEPLHMGVQAGGGPNSGHAWLESWPDGDGCYDAEFIV
jgi:hypothetical protein